MTEGEPDVTSLHSGQAAQPRRRIQTDRPPRRRRRPRPGRRPIGWWAAATVFDIRDMSVTYGTKRALDWTTMKIYRNLVTAVIGPSGCGKSTFIRSLNRMNDSMPGFALGGQVLYHGHDLYAPATNRVEVRRRIGMVFQKPNPFPKSIYDNVAWAPRNLGIKHDLDERVERALRGAALWDEVKDRLKDKRAQPLRRPAAAALHRPGDRHRARRAAARRARLGAGPDRHGVDRGADARRSSTATRS